MLEKIVSLAKLAGLELIQMGEEIRKDKETSFVSRIYLGFRKI